MGVDTSAPTAWSHGAERFGFNAAAAARPAGRRPRRAFPTEFPDDQGNGPLAQAVDRPERRAATPLQMALVAAGVANDGVIMAPHVHDRGPRRRRRRSSTRTTPESWTQADRRPQAAATMREAMIGVVAGRHRRRGSQIPGFDVGGKTGTAQLGTDPPRVARLDHRLRRPARAAAEVAVAVIVESQPGASEATGGRVAAPIAQAVMARLRSRRSDAPRDRPERPVLVRSSDRMTVQRPLVFNGRYELHRRLARGGMAEVFLARDLLLDRPVAVKVLFPEFATDPAFVERFRREAQAAANLNHPNIVGVYDWGEEDGTYFIVMEYVEGRSLAEIIRADGPLHARPGRRRRHRRRRRPRLRPPQRRGPPRRQARQRPHHRRPAR